MFNLLYFLDVYLLKHYLAYLIYFIKQTFLHELQILLYKNQYVILFF